ncbi:hypothetical protein M422DRAFT_245960 [Sphaerobolus stellatus SS14]|nr:hypothetical protein M422DRAFT_245960 [Sphaerobolus stellatus SS14]
MSDGEDGDSSGQFELENAEDDWEETPASAEELLALTKKAKVVAPKHKGAAGKTGSTDMDIVKEFVAYVPHGFKKDGHARLVIPMSTTWDGLLELVYKAAGCDRIPRKPDWTQWKFEKRGSKLLDLNEAAQFEAVKADILKILSKKPTDNTDVNIIFPEDYLKSLRVYLGGKPVGGGRGRKEQLLNLTKPDLSGAELPSQAFSNSFDYNGTSITSDGMTLDEKEKLEKLMKKLLLCEGCPHISGSFCARHPNGAHVRLTARHVKSWAKCWASDLQGADFHFPPSTSPLFVGFFKATPNSTVDLGGETNNSLPTPTIMTPALTTPTPSAQNSTGTGPLAPVAAVTNIDVNTMLAVAVTQMLQFQSHMLKGPSLRMPNQVPLIGAQVAPEPVIQLNTAYPSFDKFFEDLPNSIKNRCDTGSILKTLSDARIYQISELELVTDEELKQEGMPLGDIKWLRREVLKAIQAFNAGCQPS